MGGTARERSGRPRLTRLVIVAVTAWIAVLATAMPASAHPFLLFTDPALDGAVTESPESVALVFNEAVTVNPRAITVTDSRGRSVAVGAAHTAREGTVVVAAVTQKLTSGVYRVQWEVTGVDGHGADGEFRFAVGTVITDAGAASSAQATDWTAAGIRGLLLAGFALAFGGLVGERITARARRDHDGLPRLRSWSQPGAVLGLLATVAAAALLIRDVGSMSALRESDPGRVVVADAAGFGLALVLLALRRPLWALLPLAGVALAEGFGSHSQVEVPIAGAVLTGVHLAAAGLWTGALLHTGRAALRWRSTRPAARRVLFAYARMAAWLFVIVVATGLTMALLLVPLPALTSSTYGRLLLAKLALVTLATVLALAGRWFLRRKRLGRVTNTARGEAATLVAVLAATAVLVSTPTPGTFAAPPPPPPRGIAVPAGGLAGQVGVNVVASEGQVVVRLATPSLGNVFEPAETPEYTLSGHVQPTSGPQTPVRFRSCGGSCFVAPVDWRSGNNVLSLRADASGWGGGAFAAFIPWPAEPADELVERTVRVMRGLDEFTLYEAGTSDAGTALPEPQPLTIDGKQFLDNEPYNSGVAPIAARVTSDSGATRLLMGFPAAGTYAQVTLDGIGRITEETLTGPNHVFKRRFVYPDPG